MAINGASRHSPDSDSRLRPQGFLHYEAIRVRDIPIPEVCPPKSANTVVAMQRPSVTQAE